MKHGGAAEGWKLLRVPKSSFGTRQKETAEGWRPLKVQEAVAMKGQFRTRKGGK